MTILERQKELDAAISGVLSLASIEWGVMEEDMRVDYVTRIKMIGELFWCMRFLSASEDGRLHSEICDYHASFANKHGE